MDKEKLETILDRYKRLYLEERGTLILAAEYSWGSGEEDYKPLEEWGLPGRWKEYMDASIRRELAFWDKRRAIDDDYLPSMRPFYGIAEHSSFFGGRVDYGGDTSYHHPVIDDISQVDAVAVDEGNEHYRMLIKSMEYLKEKRPESGLVVSLRGAESPLDIANALRGNDIFLDMYDQPRDVHTLLEKCSVGLKWNLENQLKLADRVDGGVIAGLGIWMPGRSVGHISEDTSSMCSTEMYEEFGLPYSQKVLSNYDGVCIHVHGMGAHVLPFIKRLKNLLMVQIQDDPNQPSPLEIFKANAQLLKDTIVMMRMSSAELYDSKDFLKDKRTIIQISPSSDEEAAEIVQFARRLQR
jgi:hypothetical protein